uniref:Putative tho complex subunit 7 n=1 Tax=Xenopsylla cheopis TaxID=163159 RepID=A0A6M2DLQ1_XENCH
MSEEEVIRRRLLLDGDGTGDDRRLNILFKTMLKWCNGTEDSEECCATHDKMLAQLSQCEYAVIKSKLAADMTASELYHYGSMLAAIEKSIGDVRLRIEQNKEGLKVAKTIRYNRMQYDSMAQIITEHPDRQATQEQLDHLSAEIDLLNKKNRSYQECFDERKKEFNVFVTSLHHLLAMLVPVSDNMSLDGFEDIIDMDRYCDEELKMQE